MSIPGNSGGHFGEFGELILTPDATPLDGGSHSCAHLGCLPRKPVVSSVVALLVVLGGAPPSHAVQLLGVCHDLGGGVEAS
jgi:hypothetical protein